MRAKHVALCCNAYMDDLAPRLRARIMPVGTYIVATEPLGQARIEALMRENVAVTDVNWVLDYFRRSADHRLLFGGRVSYSGLDPLNTERATRARMVKVFPQLADVKIDYAWGGYVDITMSRAPDFGRLSRRMCTTCRASPATASRSPAWRASWWPKRSPARRSASICSRSSSTAISRAARCCGRRRWCSRCSGSG